MLIMYVLPGQFAGMEAYSVLVTGNIVSYKEKFITHKSLLGIKLVIQSPQNILQFVQERQIILQY